MSKDISWHLRYYDYSFLAYVGFCVAIVLFYVLVYCLRVPINRVPNLESILEDDPVITDTMLEKLGLLNRRAKRRGGRSSPTSGKLQYCIVSDPKTGAIMHSKAPPPMTSSLTSPGGSRRTSWQQQQQQHNYWDPNSPEALGARFRFIGALNRQWRSPDAEAETLSALLGD